MIKKTTLLLTILLISLSLAAADEAQITWGTETDWNELQESERVIAEDFPGDDRNADKLMLGYPSEQDDKIAYWPYEDGEGDTTTDVAGDFDADATGVEHSSEGILGSSSFQFDSSESITSPFIDLFQDGQAFTVTGWFKLDDASSNQQLLSVGDDTNAYRYLHFVVRDREPQFHFYSDNLRNYGGEVDSDEWYHFAGVWEGSGGDRILYINGEEWERDNPDEDLQVTEGSETGGGIRHGFYDGSILDGNLDEMKIFDTDLSSSEVEELYQTAEEGYAVTDWKEFGFDVPSNDLILEELEINLNGQDVTFTVEAGDASGDVVDTSDPIDYTGLSSYDVDGMNTEARYFRVRADLETNNPENTPEIDEFSLGLEEDGEPDYDAGSRYIADDTDEYGDDAQVGSVNPEFGITPEHSGDQDLDVYFRSDEIGLIGRVSSVSSGEEVSVTSGPLDSTQDYSWYVEVCDRYNQCEETDVWDFEIDIDDERRMIDGFHPQGLEEELEDDHRETYDGHINFLMDNSTQLQPGMDTTVFGMSSDTSDPDFLHNFDELPALEEYEFDSFIDDPEEGTDSNHPLWYDTEGDEERASQFGIGDSFSLAVDSTGNLYPTNVTHAHPGVDNDDYEPRDDIDDPTIPKPAKAHGNALPVIADTIDFESDSGTQILPGHGVWINPDDIKELEEYYKGDWEDKLHFQMDLTGPDAGLGFNSSVYNDQPISEGSHRVHDDQNRIIVGDIHFQKEEEDDEEVHEYLNPDMCGDDQREYLLEELGEIDNSERLDGEYACAISNNYCVDRDADDPLFEEGEYRNIDNEWKEAGAKRLKDSEQACSAHEWEDFDEIEEDPFPAWYNQDLHQDYCRENTLYGEDAKRWITEDYVQEHPFAVRGGINDDWNPYIENNVFEDESLDWESQWDEPSQFTDDNWVAQGISPVPTATIDLEPSIPEDQDKQVTLGFCAGDDAGEYYMTQQSETQYVSTDRDIEGVGSMSDQCVLDGNQVMSERSDITGMETQDLPQELMDNYGGAETLIEDERMLFNSGDIVDLQFDTGQTTQIACFDGYWFDEWPVISDSDEITVGLGGSRDHRFQLVNPTDEDTTYQVEVEPESDSSVDGAGLESFTTINNEEGMTFETEVPARDSESFDIEIVGGNLEIDTDNSWVTVTAEDGSGEVAGESTVNVGVEESTDEEGQEVQQVPGISIIQILTVVLLSALVILNRSYQPARE